MKAIEIEIKYSLRDYYRVVVERASSKIQMRTSKLVSGRKQWLW